MQSRALVLTVVCLWLSIGAQTVHGQDGTVLDRLGIDVHGFLDMRGGTRTGDDPHERDTSLGEIRLQTDISRMGHMATVQVRADFLCDDVAQETDLDLETGTGAMDLREANVLFSPCSMVDMKIGRQILTWGTGDLLFINDLFPKDWQSFFVGRDEEYLKAPSDALFVSFFPDFANIDVAYAPRFDGDRYISGERLSFWDPMGGSRSGRHDMVEADTPDKWFHDDEVSLRVYGHVAGYELALYGYNGFWKSPKGMDPQREKATFPRLWAYGVSLQGLLGNGLVNVEAGHYVSKDDESGKDPFVPNAEWRLLAGYEREMAKNLTAKCQYYLEYMENYGHYRAGLEKGQKARDKDRHVLTLRLTKLALNQNMTLSFFAYFSPSDADAYLRPMVKYKVTDSWLVMAGGNVFIGKEDHTFFGQFEKNTNVYAGLRYSF
ncbi:MAG: hypothetical protein SWE60_16185 [Thermodesulfobacteriota bacterium]|nr:hypothetical protein [Thermodesulfobacteriota bacterium]